jgi:uncharacterized protein (DUF362 family)
MRHVRRRWTRRDFLNRGVCGIAGGLAALHLARTAEAQPTSTNTGQVALLRGDSRADNVYRALKLIEPRVREGLARKKTVVIKPNMVTVGRQLAATHAECLEGILEFLKPLVKEEIVIAESAADGPAAAGYSNYGYNRLKNKYPIRLIDLDEEPFVIRHMVNERHHPRPVRFSRLLAEPDVYVISAAVMKTHDRAVVTLGLKNLAVGAILKDRGFKWGPGSKGTSDKWLVHGGPANQGIHYNMFMLARQRPPDLTVLDGFQGMEHNGPTAGTPVDHKVAVASTDWLAADRVGVELMGFDFSKIGYLTFCAQAGLGRTDLNNMEVLGERISDCIRRYRPHDRIEQQYKWM